MVAGLGVVAGDHPRMRGEDQMAANNVEFFDGSPPHARGRRAYPGSFPGGKGITPACAGKTV